MKPSLLIIIMVLSFSLKAMLRPEFRVNGDTGLSMNAGVSATWSLLYRHGEGNMAHKMFMSMHAKNMHMIVVNADLSHLAHIHPYLDKDSGEFSIDVNKETRDFDNQDLKNVIPFKGNFFVFTEVMPMFHDGRESSMLMNRFLVTANSDSTVRKPEKTYFERDDFRDARYGITRYFTKSGDLGVEGDDLKVVFRYEQFDFCDRYLPKFYFSISERDSNSEYKPVESFNRWLGMGGHSILLSAEGRELKNRVFHHLHAFLPMAAAGEFVFPYHDHNRAFVAGNYKIWGQMRIGNTVYKFPFPFKYTLPDEEGMFSFLNFCR